MALIVTLVATLIGGALFLWALMVLPDGELVPALAPSDAVLIQRV